MFDLPARSDHGNTEHTEKCNFHQIPSGNSAVVENLALRRRRKGHSPQPENDPMRRAGGDAPAVGRDRGGHRPGGGVDSGGPAATAPDARGGRRSPNPPRGGALRPDRRLHPRRGGRRKVGAPSAHLVGRSPGERRQRRGDRPLRRGARLVLVAPWPSPTRASRPWEEERNPLDKAIADFDNAIRSPLAWAGVTRIAASLWLIQGARSIKPRRPQRGDPTKSARRPVLHQSRRTIWLRNETSSARPRRLKRVDPARSPLRQGLR